MYIMKNLEREIQALERRHVFKGHEKLKMKSLLDFVVLAFKLTSASTKT